MDLIHAAGFTVRVNPIKGFEYNSREFRPEANRPYYEVYGSLFIPEEGLISTGPIKEKGLGYEKVE